jgi:hypothetical protein
VTSANGDRIDLPLTGAGTWTCPADGSVYTLDGDRLSRTAPN